MTQHSEKLVQLNSPTKRAGKIACLLQGPLVHHFFLAGILSGFFGSAYLGVHMWLMFNGQMPVPQNYGSLKELHALLQVYGFIGLFILGFLLQSAPKVFGGKTLITRSAVLIVPGVLIGIFALFLLPQSLFGRCILALSFASALLLIFLPLLRSSAERRMSVGVPIVLGSSVLVAGTFLRLDIPPVALFVTWGGIISIVIGASQQFIAGALGGNRISLAGGRVLTALLLTSTLALGSAVFGNIYEVSFWRIIALLCAATLLTHGYASGLWKSVKLGRDPLAISFLTGIFWALTAAVGLARGPQYADLVLHTLLLGLAIPLIISVSSRIITFLSGLQVLSDRWLLALIIIWQVVPFFRGLLGHAIDPRTSWLVIVATSIVFIVWPIALIRGIWAIYRRQFMLHQGEKMLQC